MLKDRSNEASMLNPPFSVQAEMGGLRNMGLAVRFIGPYQGPGAFVMRPWARANADTLVRYIQALVEGHRWAMNPANKSQAVAMRSRPYLFSNSLAPTIAATTLTVLDLLEGGDDLRRQLERNAMRFREGMAGAAGAPGGIHLLPETHWM